ncbi:hypothetical protein DPMN_019649 [Dreissena polymorpha]|uniref:Uncharacterized protein n=1 Tax=Dreissena polymorpha TaxID=45954 RepID=A0A9D4S7I4_DREPO|nr:hypothetical protein DPMN_019649 [Dreissena polymorpha]
MADQSLGSEAECKSCSANVWPTSLWAQKQSVKGFSECMADQSLGSEAEYKRVQRMYGQPVFGLRSRV